MSNKCCPNKKKCRGGTLFSKMMSQRTQNKHTQHIPVSIWSLTVFIFVNLPAKPSLLKRLPLNHTQFLRKGSHSTYSTEAFQNDEVMTIHIQKHWYEETEFSSKGILSIGIQCGEFIALSKWLPGTSPLVCTILHSLWLFVTVA